MNKRLSIVMAVLLLVSAVGFAQSKFSGPFTLSLDVSKLQEKPGKLYLRYYNAATETSVMDSAEVNGDKNTLVFKGTLDEPLLASLRFMPKPTDGKPVILWPRYYLNFYLEPGTIKLVINDTLSNAVVKGSKSQDNYASMQKIAKVYTEKLEPLYAEYSAFMKAKDTASAKKTLEKVDAVRADIKENVYKKFFLENAATTPVALTALSQYAGYDINYKEVAPLFDKLSPAFRDLPSGKRFATKLEISKKTGIGAMAMDFTQNDTLDNPISLSSFRGKYVLLDFWASWCGPCRAENPNVVKSFQKYNDKGFTILSVSLDQPGQKEKWMKAIHDDHLTWTHVSDLKFWNNAVAKQYSINAVPMNFLIDPSGKIVAKNLRADALEKKLSELLGASAQVN